MIIDLLPEGLLESHVGHKLIRHCCHEVGITYSADGCTYIKNKAAQYHHSGFLVAGKGLLILTDLRDSGEICPSAALQTYLLKKVPQPSQAFMLRFAVWEMESWLLADREGLADFLGIRVTKMPRKPEMETLPKLTLVNLARKSRKRIIRDGIVPPPGHRGPSAPSYTSTMTEFVQEYWNISAAAQNSPSLQRCIVRLQSLGA